MKTKETPAAEKPRGTRELLERVAPNLYRHKLNRTYYGIKTVDNKLKSKALGPEGNPTTDRRTADGFLAEWLVSIGQTDASQGDMTLDKLLVRFAAVRAGKQESTRVTDASAAVHFRASFPRPMTTLVSRVKTSDLIEWLGGLKAKGGKPLRHSTVNRYRQFLADLFKVAVIDRVVTKMNSPYQADDIHPKKKQHVERAIPSAVQFEDLIEEIRNPGWGAPVKGKAGGQRPMHFPESADFAEFLGRIGVGQAEAAPVTWEDVGPKKIKFTRAKTGAVFYVTIFADARPLLERMRAAQGGENATGRLFKILSVRKAMSAAAKRLGLKRFTQRNLRSMHICSLMAKGVDVKFIAQEQGHKDGGKLILDTYSNVTRGDHSAWEAEQVARAEGKIVDMPQAAA